MNHPSRTVVETRCGAVRGSGMNSVAFLGIPYAEAPVGALRFAAPIPRKRWTGIRNATAYGPTSQRRPFDALEMIPEPSIPGDDVLGLNVFTPAPNLPSAKLPVLVWIHGGGYVGGSPASPWYNGKSFNARGIVTVSIGYRLGFDGFAYIEDAPAPANRGLLDQILALHWVRENIAQFGGDPNRVTIAGQSAGGGSVLCLMASPRARGRGRRRPDRTRRVCPRRARSRIRRDGAESRGHALGAGRTPGSAAASAGGRSTSSS